jgi:pilus assembly protein Flp/PilA
VEYSERTTWIDSDHGKIFSFQRHVIYDDFKKIRTRVLFSDPIQAHGTAVALRKVIARGKNFKSIQKGETAMLNKIMNFVRDEEGASAVEYGLLAALIAAVIVGIVTTLGNQLNTAFTTVSNALP